MRCECCNNPLSDVDATAKFVEKDGSATRFVNMCKKCRSFLPPDVQVRTRSDLESEVYDPEYMNEFDNLYGEDDGYEE